METSWNEELTNENAITPLTGCQFAWSSALKFHTLISIVLTCLTSAMFTANLHVKCSDIADHYDTSLSSSSTNSSGIIKPASSDFRWLWGYIKTALLCVSCKWH